MLNCLSLDVYDEKKFCTYSQNNANNDNMCLKMAIIRDISLFKLLGVPHFPLNL